MDDWGHYSGVDFERRVHLHLRLGSRISGGVLTVRDGSIDTSFVTDALNLEQREVLLEVATAAPGRLTRSHDFTYPASTERIQLYPTGGVAVVAMAPPFDRPWLRLLELRDRSLEYDIAPIPYVDIAEFHRVAGTRWSLSDELFYFSDISGQRGPSSDYALRLRWLPQPERIALTANPVTWLPAILHEPVALGAAARIAKDAGAEHADMLAVQRAGALAKAIHNLSTFTNQPIYVHWTQEPLSGWDQGPSQ